MKAGPKGQAEDLEVQVIETRKSVLGAEHPYTLAPHGQPDLHVERARLRLRSNRIHKATASTADLYFTRYLHILSVSRTKSVDVIATDRASWVCVPIPRQTRVVTNLKGRSNRMISSNIRCYYYAVILG
jgi:hypothetical protein